MLEFRLETFANDKFKLLKMLSENQVKVRDAFYCTFSQQEIADILHFSKLKTNRLINELEDEEFIGHYRDMRGKYTVTEKGIKAIFLMEKSNA